MFSNRAATQIVIAPQIYVTFEHPSEANKKDAGKPKQMKIPMTWIQDGADFRLDVSLPDSSVLDVLFPVEMESLHVNGESVWEKSAVHAAIAAGIHLEHTLSGLRLTCTKKGSIHILAHNISQDEESL